jgi:Protein of unknown function (DUF1997)
MSNVISVQGQFHKDILLKTEIEHAYSYFTDFNFVLPRLPEIGRILRYRDGRYRMIFSADDGRGHDMGIVFDIRHELVENKHVKVVPLPLTHAQIRNDKTLGKGPFFPGLFSSDTILHLRRDHIEVNYKLQLQIEVEVPNFLRFMPLGMLQKIGETLMHMKLGSVADGFIQRLPEDFNEWYSLRQTEVEDLDQITVVTRNENGEAISQVKSNVLPSETYAN